jgi:hypothetical protein
VRGDGRRMEDGPTAKTPRTPRGEEGRTSMKTVNVFTNKRYINYNNIY